MLMGRRVYFINRKPLSYHLQLLDEHGFDIVLLDRFYQPSALTRGHDLAKGFRSLAEDDLNTAGAYILAKKEIEIVRL